MGPFEGDTVGGGLRWVTGVSQERGALLRSPAQCVPEQITSVPASKSLRPGGAILPEKPG